MALSTTTTPDRVLAELRAVVAADPVQNTVLGTIAESLSAGRVEQPWCAWNGGSAAARPAPAMPVSLSTGWTAFDELAAALGGLADLVGVRGPTPAVERLAEVMGQAPRHRMAQRLFRLDRLTAPTGIAGASRRADAADEQLVGSWIDEFQHEAFEPGERRPDLRKQLAGAGTVWLWTDPGGMPVSMALARHPTCGVARIGPVYTPVEQRGHGYGSAVTARAAAEVLQHAAIPVLFTDLANATANRIYQAIGFCAVADHLTIDY
jgi:predicted GNAT family acetyltransferase